MDSYWLSAFFFPQGFMTAVKQTFSRNYAIAVDTLTMACEFKRFDVRGVTADVVPKDGVLVYGLFMEAARFDRDAMALSESMPGHLFDEAPCMHLKPIIAADYAPVDTYSCPLYKTSLRAGTLSTTGHSTNFVIALDVPRPKGTDSDHWVQRGTAMLCMLDK